jgi:putative hydrolase of the HAD superfamily
MVKIKAIIFDWGGVLVKNAMPEILEYSARKLGVSGKKLVPAYEKYQHQFLVNELQENEFWQKVCTDLNVPVPDSPSLFGEAFKKFYEPKNEMLALVETLKKSGVLLGLLSDAEKAAVKLYFENSLPLFDALVFSSVVGVEKPDSGIYEIILKELGVKGEEAVFFDDREENIAPAQKLGIKAFLFENIKQVKNILSVHGVRV